MIDPAVERERDEDLTICRHESWSGDEGPISKLGRWHVRWRCDGCGIVRTESEEES